MKTWKILLVTSFLVSTLVPLPTQAALISTFDSSGEGWTALEPVVGGPGFVDTAAWQSSGGNPGGFLRGGRNPDGAGTYSFVSPDTWDGNWTQYINGTLQYDMKLIFGSNFFNDTSYHDIMIFGGDINNLNYLWYRSSNPHFIPNSNWQTNRVDLVASNFTIYGSWTFNQIMSNVTALYIRGEYIDSGEYEGLDNVKVNAVPEPATMLLIGSGLIGLAGLRKKFK